MLSRLSGFFKRALRNTIRSLYAITTDKNPAYPIAFKNIQQQCLLPHTTIHQTNKYLINIIEQDHRRIKRVLRGKGPFHSFRSAWRVLQNIEAFALFRKNQVNIAFFCDVLSGTLLSNLNAA